jgi:hypothetical protein
MHFTSQRREVNCQGFASAPPFCLFPAQVFCGLVWCILQVRYVGVSNETSYGVSEFIHAAKAAGLPRIQTIQNVYHLLQRGSYETDLAETCRYAAQQPGLCHSMQCMSQQS